jgi:hypothetical protein
VVLIGRARLRQRVIGIEERPSLHVGVDLANPRQARFNELLGADHAFADQLRCVRC